MEILLHFLFFTLLLGPIFLAISGFFKWKSIPLEQNGNPWNVIPMVINSSVLYALAYNTIYFIQELFLALGKKWIKSLSLSQ